MTSVRVPARIGLLGNPSDGFGGRVISATIDDFAATVAAERADRWTFDAPTQSSDAIDIEEIGAGLDAGALADGVELMAAAVLAVAAQGVALRPCHISFGTTIPRQVGLSGSSAIVIGTVRAVAAISGHELSPVDVARIALAAEVDVLGWAAGPQDRVVQSYGGLVDMRFDEPWDAVRYVQLDPTRLPPMVLAWDPRPGTTSGAIHAPIRDRWLAGEPDVVVAMDRFAALAAEGRAAIDRGDATERWPVLATEAWELRTNFWTVTDRDAAMVEAVRQVGGGASLAGSGGAITAFLPTADAIGPCVDALERSGAHACTPVIGSPHG